MSRLRFLADHDLNEHIITGVKRLNPRIEVIRVRDVGLEAASDHEVLAYAFRESLCVVSHDVNTMTSAAAATIAAGQQFSGLFLIRQTTPVRAAIETILLAWSASEHDECPNQHSFLSIDEARAVTEAWSENYNRVRPHGALGNRTPSEFALHG